jgi:thioester reductase-like protein
LPYAIEAAGLGYAESKWVTEQILEVAAQTTGLKPVIVRPGQLSGGPGGAWKTSEWFPTLLRSSQLLGHLPAIPGVSTFEINGGRWIDNSS